MPPSNGTTKVDCVTKSDARSSCASASSMVAGLGCGAAPSRRNLQAQLVQELRHALSKATPTSSSMQVDRVDVAVRLTFQTNPAAPKHAHRLGVEPHGSSLRCHQDVARLRRVIGHSQLSIIIDDCVEVAGADAIFFVALYDYMS